MSTNATFTKEQLHQNQGMPVRENLFIKDRGTVATAIGEGLTALFESSKQTQSWVVDSTTTPALPQGFTFNLSDVSYSIIPGVREFKFFGNLTVDGTQATTNFGSTVPTGLLVIPAAQIDPNWATEFVGTVSKQVSILDSTTNTSIGNLIIWISPAGIGIGGSVSTLTDKGQANISNLSIVLGDF